jgi:hypothetical protein
MKLITNIKPRRDGVVHANVAGQAYTFKADEAGDLVCDVDDKEALAALLATGNFAPYEEGDMAAAVQIARASNGTDSEDDDDLEDDDIPAGSLPLEANTPPAAIPGRGRKAR